MTENTKYISDCHKAEMKVVGDSFGEGTKHYECLECGKPCDPVLPENTRSSELGKVCADFMIEWTGSEYGATALEALIASKVEEARENAFAGGFGAGGGELEKLELAWNLYNEALQSKEEEK